MKKDLAIKKLNKPQAVEQLQFQVNPELLDRWVELDHEIWTKGLAQWPGFAGKEVWQNSSVPGEVMTVIYWDNYDQWQAIDPQWLQDTDRRFLEAMGSENVKMTGELHLEKQFYKTHEVEIGQQ